MKKSIFPKLFLGLGLVLVVLINVGIYTYLIKGSACSSDKISQKEEPMGFGSHQPQPNEVVPHKIVRFFLKLSEASSKIE